MPWWGWSWGSGEGESWGRKVRVRVGQGHCGTLWDTPLGPRKTVRAMGVSLYPCVTPGLLWGYTGGTLGVVFVAPCVSYYPCLVTFLRLFCCVLCSF